MELVAFATGIVVAGGMSIAHMGLGICTDVPWVVDDNDLGLQIGSVVGTLIMVFLIRIPSSPSSPITMSLASTIIPSSAPIGITLTFGISIPIISVTVSGVISIPLSVVPSK